MRSWKEQIKVVSITALTVVLTANLSGCGKAADTAGAVSLQAAPLAGPGAASMQRPLLNLISVFDAILGIRTAFAAVASFSSFKACNDTLILLDAAGKEVVIGGTTKPSVGRGLLTFSNSSQTAMNIGSLDIPAGTVLSEIDITFAVVPSVCSGANYAVQFDDGLNGVKDITQNTAFKFKFPADGLAITGSAQTVNLKFGDIVNGMVALGNALTNESIQTVNVGQAQ